MRSLKILDGQEYQQQKEIYKLGLTKYVEKKGGRSRSGHIYIYKYLETVNART